MENLRIMSFDLDSFTLVKSKVERSKRVIDYIRNLDIDLALLQGDKELIYNLLFMIKDYGVVYNYSNYLFLMNPILDFVDDYYFINSGAFVTKLGYEDIAFYNIKKYKKESLWEFRNMIKEYKNIDYNVVGGTLQDVGIDSFCNKYNLDNICSKPRSNHILVSKELDVKVVDVPVIPSVDVQPMVVDITYKKVRNDYGKFENT